MATAGGGIFKESENENWWIDAHAIAIGIYIYIYQSQMTTMKSIEGKGEEETKRSVVFEEWKLHGKMGDEIQPLDFVHIRRAR